MPAPQLVNKTTTRPSDPPKSTQRCEVEEVHDGLKVSFLISDPVLIRRLTLRANGMPLHKYLWENILHRAVTDAVY